MSSTASGPKRRTRDGCWTCRKRKKKCDATGPPCQNCLRLKLECENEVRLVWEDDTRRNGMRRRGPPVVAAGRKESLDVIRHNVAGQSPGVASDTTRNRMKHRSHYGSSDDRLHPSAGSEDQSHMPIAQLSKAWPPHLQHTLLRASVSPFSRPLGATESTFLEHYILRFSRTYPTCSKSNNPFLSVLLPLAMRSEVVLDSLLALSGATRWNDGRTELAGEALRFRQSALKGCVSLVGEIEHASSTGDVADPDETPRQEPMPITSNSSAGSEKLLYLLASSVLFLLYEKVSGDTTWLPHITFINELFDRYLQPLLAQNKSSGDVIETVSFLHQLFLYNDLVRSTSTHTAPLSGFYLARSAKALDIAPNHPDVHTPNTTDRYYFPNLISRISAGDSTVEDADIHTWDGDMNWLPSFALDRKDPRVQRDTDLAILSDLYRTTARVYRLRVFTDRQLLASAASAHHAAATMSSLASKATHQVLSLSESSAYETALLWPIGIAAKELNASQQLERGSILARLQSMERRFQMRHFRRAQEFLQDYWSRIDIGSVSQRDGTLPAPLSLLLG